MSLGEIRLNWHYVIWYRNFTTLVVSLILPFALLAYWNLKTLAVIRRRRRLRNRPYLPRYFNANGQAGTNSMNSEEQAEPVINVLSPEVAVAAVISLNAGTIVAEARQSSTSTLGN